MLTAEVVGYLTGDARIDVIDGSECVAFEVVHSRRGVTARVLCTMTMSEWSRGLLPSLRRGCKVLVAGFYSDHVGVGEDGSPEVRRRIRSYKLNLCAPAADSGKNRNI